MKQLQRCLLNPADYGRVLRDSLFDDPAIRDKFNHARAVAGSNPLRLRLNIGDSAPELHALRWETLCDPNDTLLSTDEYTHFSRYLSSDNWRSVQLRSKSALRALVVIANPIDLDSYQQLPPIDVAGERERALAGLGDMEAIVLDSEGKATLNHILRHLRDGYDILYLVAHGKIIDDVPYVWLEDADGVAVRVPSDDIVTRIRELVQQPRLIVLVSCQSASDSQAGVLAALGPSLSSAGVPGRTGYARQREHENVGSVYAHLLRGIAARWAN
jgi:hypothetical protein